MKPGLLAVPVLLMLPLAAAAGDADFNALVKGIETRYGVSKTRIPLFGAVKFFVKVSRPHGVKQFDLAVFGNGRFGNPDENEFDALVRNAASEKWRPMVRVRSHAPDDWTTCVYIKEEGRHVRMIVANLGPHEAVLVHYKMTVRKLIEMLARPERIGRNQ